MPTAFGGHGKGEKWLPRIFPARKPMLFLTRGCINPPHPFSNITRPVYENRIILHSRTYRERRNDRSREFLGSNTHLQIFSFDFTSLLDHNEYSLLYIFNKVVLLFSSAEKSVGIISLLCRWRKSGTPESDFPARWSDFLCSLYCFLDSPSSCYSSRAENPPLSLSLFRSFSLIKLVYGHGEPHRSCGLVNS